MDGLWYLVLNFNGKQQGATIVVRDGKVLGGDSGMTYEGNLSVDANGSINGTITAEEYLSDRPDAFFPGVESLTVSISGKKTGDSITGKATSSLMPGASISLVGAKKADL